MESKGGRVVTSQDEARLNHPEKEEFELRKIVKFAYENGMYKTVPN